MCLNELANQCYEKEMFLALEELFKNFLQWKNNEISLWDLEQKIHEHPDGTARDLYKFFELTRDPTNCVAREIIKGIIEIGDVLEDCREFLRHLLDFNRL